MEVEQVTTRRFSMCLPLILVLAFVLVASIPLAAGDNERQVRASILLSRTEASPGDNFTVWIRLEPLSDKARRIVVAESDLDGLTVASTVTPRSCLETKRTWVCIQDDLRPFAIELRMVANLGTEGRYLWYRATVAVWHNDQSDEGDGPHSVAVGAKVHVVPTSVVAVPDIRVRLNEIPSSIVPGSLSTYRVVVENRGTATAHSVSVVVTLPVTMIVVSASLRPTWRDGQLTWIVDSVPVGSIGLLFNATLPVSEGVERVDLGLAATYGDGRGGVVLVETLPSSLQILPLPKAPPTSPLPGLIVVAVVAFVVRGLFVAPGPIGAALPRRSGADEVFLLHRSGVLLRHVSSKRARETDTDILGGMLAAVRMFVEDSMSPTAGPLQEIRFGGGSIVFVTGSNATLAAVNARGNRDRFAHRAMGFLREFETANGEALANFDGMAGPLQGVESLLSRIAS
jgi:uncharacterized repeat protein (TIGR01451 family)